MEPGTSVIGGPLAHLNLGRSQLLVNLERIEWLSSRFFVAMNHDISGLVGMSEISTESRHHAIHKVYAMG